MPPPPPPAPPAPPAFTPPPASNDRKKLLGSIEGFKKGKLKKSETNDRSAPVLESEFSLLFLFLIEFPTHIQMNSQKRKNQREEEAQ